VADKVSYADDGDIYLVILRLCSWSYKNGLCRFQTV